MKKIFIAAIGLVLLAASPVFAQYRDRYGNGMATESWFAMAIFGILSLIVGAFVFSWIFWTVGERIIGMKLMDWAEKNHCKTGWIGKDCCKTEVNMENNEVSSCHRQN